MHLGPRQLTAPDLHPPSLGALNERSSLPVLIWKFPKFSVVCCEFHVLLGQSLWPCVFGHMINPVWVMTFSSSETKWWEDKNSSYYKQ